MRITKHGERKKNWWIGKKLKCKACKCHFQLTVNDKPRKYFQSGSCVGDCGSGCNLRHGAYVYRRWEVRCPECKESVVFAGPAT